MADQAPVTPFQEPAAVVPVEPVTPVVPVVVPDQVPTAPTFVLPETVKGLVGEGMKYATPEAALESLPHAQKHIESLEQEMVDLREDLSKRVAVEDVLKEINKNTPASETEPQLSQEQLDALIDNRLQFKTNKDIMSANTAEVVNKFIELYGDKDKAHEAYSKKAQDLGLSIDHLNELSATSPKALYSLFGLAKPDEIVPTKIHSNVNSEATNFVQQVQEPVKSVMGRSTHKDDIAAWNAAKPTD